jgi:hypothetical protein
MSIGTFTVLMVLLMLFLEAVSHICGWMDQFNLKNVLKLLKHLILTLLSMPYYLQHMVSCICVFCLHGDSTRKEVDSNHSLQLVGLV